MSEESQLQVRPKDGDSSLSLSKVRSGLIARGRRDAAILAGSSSLVPTDPLSATRRLAEEGYHFAQEYLGDAYYEGASVPQNYTEAVKWYRRAADQGNADAQFYLGVAYAEGKGVSQDCVLAHMWFNLSASNSSGEDQAQRAKARDDVAKELTPQQLVEAQQLAREWRPTE